MQFHTTEMQGQAFLIGEHIFPPPEKKLASIPDWLLRLKQKVIDHHLHTAPTNVDTHPTTAKRCKRNEVWISIAYMYESINYQ